MVAFTKGQMPNSINTVEGVAAWATALLTALHFQDEIQEVPGAVQKVAVSQVFPIENQGAYELRYVGRCSLPVNQNFLGGGKIWERVMPLSNASIPAEYTA
ncbi:hypothetical protein HJG54_35300 (plasmid) [Leptolyngbya sp. NK1-12]|uniref:Uncharacterized protein n=1 Tax=Leptolyngbya sp. NK1-12 TaxID=2547451 RepID=A0AA96WZU1_9CYAN|nr:hypothetical protein [Leptolyngbya sp. NK1-12]WNZ28182.1 hypothetical protein HJG54_35300 [Leptolyngbya sp. NK1-12]